MSPIDTFSVISGILVGLSAVTGICAWLYAVSGGPKGPDGHA